MIATYRRVLGLPGALAFSLSGLVARLPISMVSLGIVLLVSTRTGSYAVAGGVSAAYLVASAVMAVPVARLVDRLGQRRVLGWAVAGFAVSLSLLMVSVELGGPRALPYVWAAIAGATQGPVGSCVRARWSALLPDKTLLQTAFAFEAVADETVFMVGPALVTVLATAVHPLAGLVSAVLAAVVGTTVLISQRRTEPVPTGVRVDRRSAEPMGWPVLGPLTVCAVGMGMLFGGTEVATVALCDELGHKVLAGPMLAVWALGSLLAGVLTGAFPLRAASGTRFRWGLLALGLLMVPLPLVHSFVPLIAVLFLSGFAVSPTLIASVAWTEETVPAARLTEGMTIFTTGLAAGLAPGAAVVGAVVDAHGASAGFLVPVVAGLGGAAIAFLTRTRVRPSPSGSPS